MSEYNQQLINDMDALAEMLESCKCEVGHSIKICDRCVVLAKTWDDLRSLIEE